MPISVVIQTYNASRYLHRVLQCVKGFDEIVVCDMESTDNTLNIAQEYGCRTITLPRLDYTIAEPYRNTAIKSAQYEWVLLIDADELVSASLQDYLYKYIEDPVAAAIRIPRKNYVFGSFQRSSYPDYQIRFFRRDAIDWPPTIHSTPIINGDIFTIPTEREDLALVHLQANMSDQLRRMNTYTDNEVKRRRAKKATLLKLWLEPKFRFFKSYVMKGGFRQGTSGYILAKRDAFYRYALLSKLFEEQEAARQGLNELSDGCDDKLNLSNK